MYIPAYETLETARALHSFAERASLYFLMAVVGLELVELYLEHAMWGWRWNPFGKQKTLLSPQSLIKVAGVMFFGIAMALEYVSIGYSDTVDRLSDDVVTYEQRQTRAAMIVAGNANKAAGGALGVAATANTETARLQKEAEDLKKKAEDERLERVRLEQLVSPRMLTPEKQRLIADRLRRFSGRAVTVESYGMDGEGVALATELLSAFTSAGLRVTDDRAAMIVSGGFKFAVHVNGPANQQDLVIGIAEALGQLGGVLTYANAPEPRSGAIMGGQASLGGNAVMRGGGGPQGPAGPTPPDSPVIVFVGIKMPQAMTNPTNTRQQ